MTAFARASHVLDAPLRALWGLGVVGGLSDRQVLDSFLTGEGESANLRSRRSWTGTRRWSSGSVLDCLSMRRWWLE